MAAGGSFEDVDDDEFINVRVSEVGYNTATVGDFSAATGLLEDLHENASQTVDNGDSATPTDYQPIEEDVAPAVLTSATTLMIGRNWKAMIVHKGSDGIAKVPPSKSGVYWYSRSAANPATRSTTFPNISLPKLLPSLRN